MKTAKFLQNNSIATQLIKIVFGLYCVIAIIVTISQIVMEYYYTKNQIKNELAINEQIFSPVLSIGLWDLDDEQINNTIKGMLAIPIITGVRIVQEQQIYAAIGKITNLDDQVVIYNDFGVEIATPTNTEPQLFTHSFDIKYQYQGTPRFVGHATLYSDSDVVIQRVEMGIILLIINSVIKTLALWILFFYVGKHILLKPLTKLVNAIQTVKFNQLEEFKIDLQNNANNELTVIQDAFATMVEDLATARRKVIDLNNNLEQKIQRRTIDLKLAKEDAERANQAKSIFMSRINHELRTPLNAIVGCSQVLETNLNTPQLLKEHALVEHTLDAAEHLLMLYEDIMDVVIMSGKEVKIPLDSYAIDPIVQSSIAMTDSLAKQKDISVTYHPCQLDVYANDGRLKQVFINLLNNAIKYNKTPGEIHISINKIDNHQLQISFKDTGVGMAQEDLEHIFEPLNRLAYAEDNCIEGTGIGLSIVRNLVSKMNGTIDVHSQINQGSEFIITLPIQKPN